MYYFVCTSQDSGATALKSVSWSTRRKKGDVGIKIRINAYLTSPICTSEGGCCSCEAGERPPGQADSVKHHIIKLHLPHCVKQPQQSTMFPFFPSLAHLFTENFSLKAEFMCVHVKYVGYVFVHAGFVHW